MSGPKDLRELFLQVYQAVVDLLDRNIMRNSMLIRLARGHNAVGRDKRIEYLIGEIKASSLLIFSFVPLTNSCIENTKQKGY
jgi:hypothetical protein